LSHIRNAQHPDVRALELYSNGWFTTVLTPTGCVNGGDSGSSIYAKRAVSELCADHAQLTASTENSIAARADGEAHYNALLLRREAGHKRVEVGFTTALTLQQARSMSHRSSTAMSF